MKSTNPQKERFYMDFHIKPYISEKEPGGGALAVYRCYQLDEEMLVVSLFICGYFLK